MNTKNMLVVFATTFNSLGESHSDIPVVGLVGRAQERVEKILGALKGRRTRWERSGQPCPSLYFALDLKGEELETWHPPRILLG